MIGWLLFGLLQMPATLPEPVSDAARNGDCPSSPSGEIMVCGRRKGEQSPYRLPKIEPAFGAQHSLRLGRVTEPGKARVGGTPVQGVLSSGAGMGLKIGF